MVRSFLSGVFYPVFYDCWSLAVFWAVRATPGRVLAGGVGATRSVRASGGRRLLA
jgi:hypothetical protein